MTREKPVDADKYGWEEFEEMCCGTIAFNTAGWMPFWEKWKIAYQAGIDQVNARRREIAAGANS